MHFFFGGEDDEEQKPAEPVEGTEAGNYALADDIGERIGEGEDHNPATLGDL